MSTMTKATAYAVLSRAVAAQRNGSAPEQVARLDAALAVAGEVLLAREQEPAPTIAKLQSWLRCSGCGHEARMELWKSAVIPGKFMCDLCYKAGLPHELNLSRQIMERAPLLPVKPDGN